MQAAPDGERRKAPRYRLQLPVLFSWNDGQQIHTQGGFTRDVSVKGLFIGSAAGLRPETPLQLEIVLPAFGKTEDNIIRTSGEVVRVSSERKLRGFAVSAALDTDLCSSR
jgi:hypothetical protein